jgi:hypothetical protein
MNHLEAISEGLKQGKPFHEIARKVFLTYPTKIFVGDEERQYRILNEIAAQFDVPIHNIHACGSAKIGRSFHKHRDFAAKESDLDVAILDARLFATCVESVLSVSKGYSDRTGFHIRDGVNVYDEYIQYLARGIFRPDLMPSCPERAAWHNFFGKLSDKHSDLFKSITAGIYLSQSCFEQKQRSVIRNYQADRPI